MNKRSPAARPPGASPLSRRCLLHVLPLIPAAFALPSLALAGTAPNSWRSTVSALLSHRASARRVASLAIAQGLLSPSPDASLSTLRETLGYDGVSIANIDTAELRQRVRARIRADFRTGRTCRLVGWQFSVTELQICSAAIGRDERA